MAGSDGTMHFPFGQEAKKAGIHSARRVINARKIFLPVQFLCFFYRKHRDQKERQPDEAIPNQNPMTRIFGAGQNVGYAPRHGTGHCDRESKRRASEPAPPRGA